MDYYLSSDLMEPADAKSHYSEQLVCLPNLSIYYEPTATTPAAVSRSDFGLRSSATVFWCGQSLFKYLPQFDQIYPRIAREVGDCQFVFIHFPDGVHIKALFQQRLELAFNEYGLKYAEHCVILPKLDSSLFAALLGQSDIVLDFHRMVGMQLDLGMPAIRFADCDNAGCAHARPAYHGNLVYGGCASDYREYRRRIHRDCGPLGKGQCRTGCDQQRHFAQ